MRLRDSVAICGYREPYTIYLDNQVCCSWLLASYFSSPTKSRITAFERKTPLLWKRNRVPSKKAVVFLSLQYLTNYDIQMLSEPEPSQPGDLSIFIQRWRPSEFKVCTLSFPWQSTHTLSRLMCEKKSYFIHKT